VHDLACDAARLPDHISLRDGQAAVLGFVERGSDTIPYNSAALVQAGAVHFLHRKLYLPTYGMFDEGRHFGRGQRIESCEHRGLRLGILICEDFWHPSLSYLLACQHIDLLLVLAAAPGRDVASAEPGHAFASTAVWERMARTTAQLYGIYVALCNRVGVEGAISFAGGSLVVDPTGEVRAAEPEPREAVFEVAIDLADVARARRPYAHLRDEEPRFVLRQLERILAAHA
jgi:predicted amidohydrolase